MTALGAPDGYGRKGGHHISVLNDDNLFLIAFYRSFEVWFVIGGFVNMTTSPTLEFSIYGNKHSLAFWAKHHRLKICGDV